MNPQKLTGGNQSFCNWQYGFMVYMYIKTSTNAARSPCMYVAISKLQQLGASVIETVSTEGRYKYRTELTYF